MQKEQMKLDCVNTYVEVCYSILVTFRTTCTPIAKACLQNLRLYLGINASSFCMLKCCYLSVGSYVAWLELPLIVNNRFLPLFYDMLSDEELRESVCECLYEVWAVRRGFHLNCISLQLVLLQIVMRGMEPMLKIDLLHNLNLLPLISSIKTNVCKIMVTRMPGG